VEIPSDLELDGAGRGGVVTFETSELALLDGFNALDCLASVVLLF
jgi:hypothetical protein